MKKIRPYLWRGGALVLAAALVVLLVLSGMGLSFEAEIGSIGGTEDGVTGQGEVADPEQAAAMIKTGIDFLAAGIGNIHGIYPANRQPTARCRAV